MQRKTSRASGKKSVTPTYTQHIKMEGMIHKLYCALCFCHPFSFYLNKWHVIHMYMTLCVCPESVSLARKDASDPTLWKTTLLMRPSNHFSLLPHHSSIHALGETLHSICFLENSMASQSLLVQWTKGTSWESADLEKTKMLL